MLKQTIPTVSVVMPAYNAEKYLREAIESILSQTYDDFEFIIINDGSTDKTKEIILSYSDPRIVYIENEQNSGICVTLNKGLDAARGKYIARMDSDDIAIPRRLETQVRYMDANPKIGASGSDIEIFGEGITPYIFTQLHTPDECSAGLLFNSCFAHPSVIIRKDILDQYNLRYKDEFRGLEDYELWWQISRHSGINNIAQPLLRYRHHKAQVTQNVTKRVHDAFIKFTKCRFNDLNIVTSDYELHLLNAYSTGLYSRFDDDSIMAFIELSRKIIEQYPIQTNKVLNALKLTLAKSITFILHNTGNNKVKRQKYYNKSLKKGIFPVTWFTKVTIHNLFR